MRAVIFCGGEIEDYSYIDKSLLENSLIICADGGLRHTEAMKIVPDIIIGDNDSWQREYPEGIRVIKCPAEKDYTDTERCIDHAIEEGCGEILIYGGLGGRLDHEFSNYCLLAYALQKGARARLINKNNEIWVENKSFTIEKSEKKYVSFFPFGGEVHGFSVKGLKYEGENLTLGIGSTLTASNEFLNSSGEISFDDGMIIVMLCDDSRNIKGDM